MDAPPSYAASQANSSSGQQPSRDPVPPYRASHRFATEEEELAALREFAQSKLYVNPGTNGTLPNVYRWSGPSIPQNEQRTEMTAEMKADKARQKAEKKAEKAKKEEEKARRGSVGDRLMRVISGGDKP